jgi:Intracellular proteinase inhibitor
MSPRIVTGAQPVTCTLVQSDTPSGVRRQRWQRAGRPAKLQRMIWIERLIHGRLPRLLTVVGMLTICLGSTTSRSCSFVSSPDTDDGNGGDRPSFVAHLELQDLNGEITDTFERRDQITLVLTVRNRLDSAASAEFPSTRTSDFVVVRENTEDVVWQWSDDKAFSQIPTTLDFLPGETKTFTVTWDQTSSAGVQVSSGTYEARGVLVYTGFDSNPLRSNQMGSTLERLTIN